MAKLKAADRKGLKTSQFGLPAKAKTAGGKAKSGSYPIPDASHARSAKAFAKRYATPEQQKQINARADRVLASSKKKGK